jgi:ankyrin repeat protein/predicted Ser/Thr protein kinase
MTPESLGGYRISSELGRGAMGVVYLGEDTRIGRPVAIKVIRTDAGLSDSGAELRRRMIREASAAGKLSHPGIVTVYHLGEEGENIFIAMEFVKGVSLESVLGKLEPARTIAILEQIAAALDFAHSAGIVHRDVKPPNILLREDGCVKVADFGIAKIAQATTQGMTAVGTGLGSPSYMSPEQVSSAQIDGRSDQFSLAVMAYELLTGKCPFAADSIPALMYQIISVDPFAKKPDHPVLTPPVTAVLGKALAKEPKDRFPNCAAFIGALKSAMGLSRVSPFAATAIPQPPPAPHPAPAVAKSNPFVPIAIGIAVLALAGGGYWFVRGGRTGSVGGDAHTPPLAAELPLIKAIQEGRLDDARGLIQKGVDVNGANPDGTTALMAAAEGNAYLTDNVPADTLLLDKGARIDAQDKRGRTALYRAVEEGKEGAVRLLLVRKANLQLKAADGSSPLAAAVTYGRLPLIKLVLQNSADVQSADAQGNTPLMIAAEGTGYMPNNEPLVAILLENGAKVETQDARGRTPLYRAATEGKTDAVRLLLDKNAAVNQKANDGSTPLLEAVTYAKVPVVRLLLERGAEVDLPDSQGVTPLMIASEGNAYMADNAPMVKILLAAGAKIDTQDSNGRSPLWRAAQEGKTDAMGKRSVSTVFRGDANAITLEPWGLRGTRKSW